MLKVGEYAPDVSLEIGENKLVNLSQFRGKKVILYFYPKDMTPGCTLEAIEFNEHKDDFEKLNAVVIGVSKDSILSHEKFKDKNELKIDLASDMELEIIKAFGVWQEKNMYGKKTMGVVRTTFIIDENGIIQKIYPKVRVKGHVDKVLEDLKEM